MLDFRMVHVQFDGPISSRESKTAHASFGSKVKKAEVAIKGVRLQYNTADDHHVLQEQAGIENVRPPSGNTVFFDVYLGLTDSDGNAAGGAVSALVIADVA